MIGTPERTCEDCKRVLPAKTYKYCSTCKAHRQAEKQRDAGLTCFDCKRPPVGKMPLYGYRRFGAWRCAACHRRHLVGQPPNQELKLKTPSRPSTGENEQALGRFLAARRARQKQR